jgi:hypothetical protein
MTPRLSKPLTIIELNNAKQVVIVTEIFQVMRMMTDRWYSIGVALLLYFWKGLYRIIPLIPEVSCIIIIHNL